jgi:4-hydroxybenzoyl-CoA reductase subunit beta
MLRLPDFELRRPESPRDAATILYEHGPDAMLVAGGTDLYPKMKRRQFTPDVLVSMERLDGLTGIDVDEDGGVTIGGSEPLDAVASHEHVRETYPAVAEAAGTVSTPTLRRMGTIGGNLCQDTRCTNYDRGRDWRESVGWCLKAPDSEGWSPEGSEDADAVDAPCRVAPGGGQCWAVFASDTAPALIAHDAEIRLVGADGERTVPLADFYRNDGVVNRDMKHDELLTEIRLPPADDAASTYAKFSQRESFDFPSLGVAAAVQQDDDGTVEEASVVLTGVGPCPVEIPDAAELLEGTEPSADVLADVGDAASRAVRPMDNTDQHPAHRRRMASVYTRRALSEVATVE